MTAQANLVTSFLFSFWFIFLGKNLISKNILKLYFLEFVQCTNSWIYVHIEIIYPLIFNRIMQHLKSDTYINSYNQILADLLNTDGQIIRDWMSVRTIACNTSEAFLLEYFKLRDTVYIGFEKLFWLFGIFFMYWID